MSDPRGAVIGKRLSGIGRVLAFLSAKGGVGKTFCAVGSALSLARAGRRVGVLDLDFQGASAHIFLGIHPRLPEEEQGILPLKGPEGLRLMSVAAFTGERALPLRGVETSDAILELFAVVRWGQLDYLFIDMPPGIGEEALDIARLVPRLEAFVVSTASSVSISVVERLLALLSEVHVPVIGVLANMIQADARPVAEMAARHGVLLAGEIPFDARLEASIGNPAALGGLEASAALGRALSSAGCR